MIRQLASFFMVVFASAAHATEAQPVIKRIGDEYEVVLTGRFGDDESAWQAAVAPTVAMLCGTKVPQ